MIMKANICDRYGSPDVLAIKEVEKPIPGDNEILVKVFATTVNRTDCAILKGKPFVQRFVYGVLRPRKTITGTDFAGVIEDVGKNVASFKVGDKVFGFDDMGIRSHAEYLTISEDNSISIMPDTITYEQAAASVEGAHYAINFLNKVNIESGQNVLVNGATGAIGSAAVQLLVYHGVNVTAVCNARDADLVKSLGAEKVIDYTNEDFTKVSDKFNYVFDAVGKSTFKKCKPVMLSGGAYISSELGPGAQNIYLPLITKFFSDKRVKFPLPLNRNGSVRLTKELSEEGNFKAVIDRTYPLSEIAEAFRYVEKGKKVGNVVITMQHGDNI